MPGFSDVDRMEREQRQAENRAAHQERQEAAGRSARISPDSRAHARSTLDATENAESVLAREARIVSLAVMLDPNSDAKEAMAAAAYAGKVSGDARDKDDGSATSHLVAFRGFARTPRAQASDAQSAAPSPKPTT